MNINNLYLVLFTILISGYAFGIGYRIRKQDERIEEIKGAIPRRCICKYSSQCRTPRQHLQCIFREDGLYESIIECDFYRLISESLKNKEEAK